MNIVYLVFYTLAKLIARFGFAMRVVHPERMIEEGPLILAVNHTSYFDPPLAGICSKRAVYFLARKNLLKWPFFGPLSPAMNVIPVERDGNDLSALREVIRKLRDGQGVVLFPEGTRSQDGDLGQPRGGIGFVIAKTQATVLPMRIFGSFEAFPRNALLPRFQQITVAIGKPLRFSKQDCTGSDRETYQHLSNQVMKAIADLRPSEN